MAPRIFFILIVLSTTFLSANGQEFKFGVKGGLNVAYLGGDATDIDRRIGFHAGGFVSVPVLAKFKVQPEIIYSQQGAQSGIGSDELKYEYLNIPAIVKFMLTKNFNIQAGPQLGILLSAKEEANSEEIDVKDSLKSTDLGIGFGLGYETNDNVMIDVRYNLGISDIADDGNNDFFMPNQVIQVSLGIAF